MAGRVHVVARPDLFAAFQPQPGHAVTLAQHVGHARLLADFAPHLFGVAQKNVVIDGARHLKGRRTCGTLQTGRGAARSGTRERGMNWMSQVFAL